MVNSESAAAQVCLPIILLSRLREMPVRRSGICRIDSEKRQKRVRVLDDSEGCAGKRLALQYSGPKGEARHI
jgi:hypothetical protein